jgi:hypothetical protein
MKKTSFFLSFCILSFTVFYSCSSPKKLEAKTGSEEITVPLSGKDYQSNKEFFRAKSSGKSPDMATAKKIALNNAKSEIAGLINTKLKSVTDNYTNQRSTAIAQDFENKFENLSREVVNQQLSEVAIIGEKTFLSKDGTYEYWVAIEISKEALRNSITTSVSKNQKLQVDYDKKKFEDVYNQEMDKMANGN